MICNRERNSQNQTNGRMEQSQRIEQNLFRRILLVALHETIKNWYETIINISFNKSTWYRSWHYEKDISIFITEGTRKRELYPSGHSKWIQLLLMGTFITSFVTNIFLILKAILQTNLGPCGTYDQTFFRK